MIIQYAALLSFLIRYSLPTLIAGYVITYPPIYYADEHLLNYLTFCHLNMLRVLFFWDVQAANGFKFFSEARAVSLVPGYFILTTFFSVLYFSVVLLSSAMLNNGVSVW